MDTKSIHKKIWPLMVFHYAIENPFFVFAALFLADYILPIRNVAYLTLPILGYLLISKVGRLIIPADSNQSQLSKLGYLSFTALSQVLLIFTCMVSITALHYLQTEVTIQTIEAAFNQTALNWLCVPFLLFACLIPAYAYVHYKIGKPIETSYILQPSFTNPHTYFRLGAGLIPRQSLLFVFVASFSVLAFYFSQVIVQALHLPFELGLKIDNLAIAIGLTAYLQTNRVKRLFQTCFNAKVKLGKLLLIIFFYTIAITVFIKLVFAFFLAFLAQAGNPPPTIDTSSLPSLTPSPKQWKIFIWLWLMAWTVLFCGYHAKLCHGKSIRSIVLSHMPIPTALAILTFNTPNWPSYFLHATQTHFLMVACFTLCALFFFLNLTGMMRIGFTGTLDFTQNNDYPSEKTFHDVKMCVIGWSMIPLLLGSLGLYIFSVLFVLRIFIVYAATAFNYGVIFFKNQNKA